MTTPRLTYPPTTKARAQLAATLPAPAGALEDSRALAEYCRGLSFGACLAVAALGVSP